MSERILNSQQGNLAVDGQGDLSSLAASKDLHKHAPATSAPVTSVDSQPANQSDLTIASISSSDVLRATPRTEMRKDISSLAASTETSVERHKGRSRAKSGTETKESGVFTNPHWEYRGNIVSKFVTLLANILKVIERLILKLFGAGDIAPLPKQGPQQNARKEAAPETTPEQERKERERKARSMHTHRS
jgi:hypothetical protein